MLERAIKKLEKRPVLTKTIEGGILGYTVVSPLLMVVSDQTHKFLSYEKTLEMRNTISVGLSEVFTAEFWPWAVTFSVLTALLAMVVSYYSNKTVTIQKVKAREAKLLAESSRIFNSSLDIKKIFDKVAKLVSDEIGETCTIFKVEKEHLTPITSFYKGRNDYNSLKILSDYPAPFHGSVTCPLVKNKEYILVSDVSKDQRCMSAYANLMKVHSYVCVPLTVKDEVLGVLSIAMNTKGRRFNTQDLKLVINLAGRAASAMENSNLYDEAITQSQRLSVVSEISKAVNSTLDLEKIYKTIIEQLKRVLPFPFTMNIANYKPEDDTFIFSHIYDPSGSLQEAMKVNHPYPGDSLILTKAFKTRQPVYTQDTSREIPSNYQLRKKVAEINIASVVNLPLIVEKNCIGTLDIGAFKVDAFSENEIALLETASSHLAIAINNANILEGLQKTNREIEFMNSILELLNKPTDISQVFREVLDRILEFVRLDDGGIYLLDETGQELHCLVHSPMPDDFLKEISTLSVKDSLSGHVVRTGKSISGGDLANHPQGKTSPAFKYGFKGFAMVPIKSKSKVLGTISTVSVGDEKTVSKDKVRLLEALGAQMGVALENLNLQLKREQTEASLLESEKRYRLLADNATDIIWTIDKDLRLTYTSPSMMRLLGFTVEEAIGRTVKEILTPSSLEAAERLFSAELAKEETGAHDPRRTMTIELEHYCKDSSPIWAEVKATFLRDDEGQVVGVLGVSRDITERKRAEEEKKRLEARVQQAEKMEAIGNLAGRVAHDLNNILSGIVGFPQLLLMDIPEDSPLKESLEIIKSSGEKATAIVNDLLTLARRAISVTEVINLNDIILKYLNSPEYKKLIMYHPRIEVETNLEADLFNIVGSHVHLTQTVMNLVSNAAEAVPDGGKIVLSTENHYIDSPINGYDRIEEGDYVVFKISDTGIGIATEDIEKIFEPFYTKKKLGRSGTGLGMTVVWGTVKDHKGYIDVQSISGEGTIITLYFPVTRKELEEHQPDLSLEDYMGKGQSILVVDDVEEQRKIASEMLNRLGYSVTTVPSGEEAVEYLQNEPVDLVVLDMIMAPGMDGLDTYKQILELYPDQKAIISSGFSETDRVKEAQELGAIQYIKKPYTLEKIGVSVCEELSR